MLGGQFNQPSQPPIQGDTSVATTRFSAETLLEGDKILEVMKKFDISRIGFLSAIHQTLRALGKDFNKLPKELQSFLMYKTKEYEQAQRSPLAKDKETDAPSVTMEDVRVAEEAWYKEHQKTDSINRLPEDVREAFLQSKESVRQEEVAKKASIEQERAQRGK